MNSLGKLLALVLSFAACVADPNQDLGDGDDDGSGGDGDEVISVSGSIAADATWSGVVTIIAPTVIEVGVVVTVDPNTSIKLKPGVGVEIKGTLDARGTKAAPVTIGSELAGGLHSGFTITSPGVLGLSYVKQTGGGIKIEGGRATVVDTYMSRVTGDFLIVDAGSVDVTYSQFGVDSGETDTTHCDVHVNRAASIRITNSTLTTAPYGLMFFGGVGADFTQNNWFGNSKDVVTVPGVSGDFTGSWFEDGAPTSTGGATLTGLDALSTTRLTNAGPR